MSSAVIRSTAVIGIPVRQEIETVANSTVTVLATVPPGTTSTAAYWREGSTVAAGQFTVTQLTATQVQLTASTAALQPGRYLYEVVSTAVATGAVSRSLLSEFVVLSDSEAAQPGGSSTLAVAELTANATAVPGTLYYAMSPTLLQLALPTVTQPGSSFGFVNYGAVLRVTQQAGQQVRMGDMVTTLGAQGRLESDTVGDWVELMYVSSALQWVARPHVGNIYVL